MDIESTCYGAQYGLWRKGALAVGHNMGCEKRGTCCGAQYGLWRKGALAVGHNVGCGEKGHLLWATIWTLWITRRILDILYTIWGHNMGFGEKSTCCGAQYGSWIQKGHLLWGTIWAMDKKSTCYGAQYGLWIKRTLATGHNMGCG